MAFLLHSNSSPTVLTHPLPSRMAAANASARGQRAAIMASPLREMTGFCLAVDCLAPAVAASVALPCRNS